MQRPSLAEHTFAEARTGVDEWRVAVVGDTVFASQEPPTVGSALRRTLAQCDLSVVNLEAPIAGPGAAISKTGPVNTTAADTPTYLRELGFDAVTLANNHTMDCGPEGMQHTVGRLTEAGLSTVGAGPTPMAALDPLVTDVTDGTAAVVNVCEREFGAADRDGPGTAWVGHPDAVGQVRDAAETADTVVVVAHGGVEYLPLPPPGHQRRLRQFVDAGADLVVGHHPHVPQGWERYDGAPICYSVGNFRYKRGTRPKTEWGLLVEATVRGGDLAEVALRPLERRGDTVAFMGERWSADRHQSYFEDASTIAADREALRAHWQELAVRVFEQRYGQWLRTAAGSDLPSLLRHPLQYLRGTRLWDGDARQRELMTLLNLVRNESHRDVIETATSVKTGAREDRRTPEIRDRVADLLATTEDRQVYDPPSSAGRLLRGATAQLRDSAGRAGARLHPSQVTDRL